MSIYKGLTEIDSTVHVVGICTVIVLVVYTRWQSQQKNRNSLGLDVKVHSEMKDLTEEEETEEESFIFLNQKQNINGIQVRNSSDASLAHSGTDARC